MDGEDGFLMALTCLLVPTIFPCRLPACLPLLGDLSEIQSSAVISSSLSLLPQSSYGSLDGGDSVIVPLDRGHGDHPGQVLGVLLVAARMIPFLVMMSLSLSLSPQSSCSGLHEDVRVVLPRMEATAFTLVKSSAWSLVAARMIHFLMVVSLSISL